MNAQRLTLATVGLAVLVVAAILIVPRLGGGGTSAAKLDIAGEPVLGQADAPVTIEVFEDFLCPHCAEFSDAVMPLIQRDFVESGKAKVAFFNFPVVDPVQSRTIGGLMECVYQQSNDAFWQLEPILFRSQNELGNTARAIELATTYAPGLDGAALRTCVNGSAGTDAVDADVKTAQQLGLTGTPSVLVNGKQIANPSYANIQSAVQSALDATD